MIRLCLNGQPPWHTPYSAHPGGLLTFDCLEQHPYQRVHVTTQDVQTELRCVKCEQKRLAAVEYFVEGAVGELEGDGQ